MDREASLARLAVAQGGVLTRRQVVEIGYSAGSIARRIAAGRWTRVSTGAYRVLPLNSDWDRLAAAVAVLPGAVVSHGSAARVHEMSDVPELSPTVLVHTKTTHQFPGVAVIRCHDLFDTHVTSKRDLPVTTPERTVVDLAAHIPIGRLGRVLDNALASGIASLERVDAVLHDVARRGKPGVATVRTLLAERSGEDHDGSILEARANKLLEDAGFERLEFEYSIPWYPQRRFDVAIPSHRLAIEWDSRAWHSQLGAFAADRERDQDAIAHGWRVLRFTWSDVHDRPIHVVSTIALALE